MAMHVKGVLDQSLWSQHLTALVQLYVGTEPMRIQACMFHLCNQELSSSTIPNQFVQQAHVVVSMSQSANLKQG